MGSDLMDLVARLKAGETPFVLATVVRTVAATAAKAGAKAVIDAEGAITGGWIGGGCARSAVVRAAREALRDGVPRLVSIQPQDLLEARGVAPGEERDGIAFARNGCPSHGTMDVFVEPVLPRPALVVFGASPVAQALAALAAPLGFAVTVCAPAADHALFAGPVTVTDGFALPQLSAAPRFIVVATQGRGDAEALAAALRAEAAFTAFVGSHRKAAALRAALAAHGDVPAERIAAFKAPAGLDLGAITPEEIALSILAEITALRRQGQRHP